MIPKVIHYCWFGSKPIGKLQKKCINSWKKNLHGYETKLWNEENSPMRHPFVKEAYKAKKYAFVADYVRLWALFNEGGIYLDTDMLVLKNFDKLLHHSCFSGYQSKDSIAAGIIGSESKHPYINDLLTFYDSLTFDLDNLSKIAIPIIITEIALQKDYDLQIFPIQYFYPFPFEVSIENPKIYKKYITPESYAVHLWDASWQTGMKEYREGKIWYNKILNKIKTLNSR